jgi:hypothetical protein
VIKELLGTAEKSNRLAPLAARRMS